MYARLCSYARSMLAPIDMRSAGGRRETAVALPDTAHAIPSATVWDDHPAAAWRQALFGAFAALPREVLAHIAGYVADGDLGAWSRTCHGAHGILRREYLNRRLPEAASAVVSPGMFQKAVPDILRFVSRRGHWLGVLARQLPLLDKSEQAMAFTLLLDAGERLTLEEQPALWQNLAIARYECGGRRKLCPIGSKLELRLYRAVVALHGIDDGHAFATVMTYCSDQFAGSFPHASWDAAVSAMPPSAQGRSLAAVQARADRLGCLPHAAFLARLKLAMSVPPEDRHLALVSLAVPNAYLPGEEAARRFAALMPAVQSLETDQQPICHAALAYLLLPMAAPAIAPAWDQLFRAMPAMEACEGAGEVLRALHVAIAFMTPNDGAQRRQQLEAYHRACTVHIVSVTEIAGDIPEPVWRHGWDVRLQAGNVDVVLSLPFRTNSPASLRVQAYQAMTQRLRVDPGRLAQQPPALQAARAKADVAVLAPSHVGNHVGFSFDMDAQLAKWNALLQGIQGLPDAVRAGPLRELVRVSGRSVPLFTVRVYMLSMGLPAGPSPREQCWDALTQAVRQLPLEQQIDLARDVAPLAGSSAALIWATEMAARAPLRDRAAMLIKLAQASRGWSEDIRVAVCRAVFRVSLPLPAAQRAGVLYALKQALRVDNAPRVDDAARLEQALRPLVDDA